MIDCSGVNHKDTFEANTLLRQNGASNDSPKKFGSGYRPSENMYGHDNDVEVNKRRKTNRRSAKPKDFSLDDNDVKEKKKPAARALARKRYSTTKIKAQHNKNKGIKPFNKYCL